jgi:putative tryptophan/tyrosine transport system substrate-binding protein
MRRREFIAALGGAAAWPVVARAEQADRVRRIGVLMAFDENDPQIRGWLSNFARALAELGWIEGRTVRLEVRWAAGNIDRMHTFAKELVALQPDVILASTTPVTAALQRDTSTIPIVFVLVSDPVGAGFVASLRRPSGNMTGFTNIEGAAFGGKWLEMLKAIAPHVRRVAIMFNPDTAPGGGAFFQVPFEAAARSLAVEPIASRVRSDAEIETEIASLGREQAGLVVMADAFMLVHRGTVIPLTVRNKVPAIGSDCPVFAREGGLLSYGPSFSEIFGQAASYVDRILRGANPGDLPVQGPTKYELVINLKTAKALDLVVPQSLLLAADEVIE